MPAFFELLLFAAAALAAVAAGRRSGKKRPPQGTPRAAAMRCPSCGCPAEVRGNRWECPYCGDSGSQKACR